VIDDISSKLSRDTPPVQLLAVQGPVPVGIAILKPHEARHLFPDFRFWLGSVFVPAPARGAGIATALCQHVELIARDLAIPRLHLQTECLDGGLYARIGFHPHVQFRDGDDDVLLMTKDLI
jgi:GNAT superfamily N-acetyltransferase